MKTKLNRFNTKTGKTPENINDPCRTCLKTCSMSGLCMMPWPEAPAQEPEEDANKAKDGC